MGNFSDFLYFFQYNFGDSWDINGMRSIILGYLILYYFGEKSNKQTELNYS